MPFRASANASVDVCSYAQHRNIRLMNSMHLAAALYFELDVFACLTFSGQSVSFVSFAPVGVVVDV